MTDKFAWYRRAQECIAQAALTNSKRPETFVKGIFPTHVAKGYGPHLFDHTGKRYLDFICGLGTNLLGYGNERVTAAMAQQLRNGFSHSLPSHHEVEAAEKLKEMMPFVDAGKFLKTGSEACSAAVRIARAKTGRSLILSDGYHGWSDQFASLMPSPLGIPDSIDGYMIQKFHDASFFNTDQRAAAVIVEPVITDWSDSRRQWLQELRDRCTKTGTLLIFDECVTGFRWPRYSVAAHWNILPDLIVLGKGIANGMPLAAVAGKYDVMNCGEYFVSSTYAGETLSLVAAKETMTLLQNKYDLEWLWKQGQAFLDEYNGIWPEKIRIEGYPTRGAFKGDDLVKALFWQESALAGILFGPSWYFNFPLATEWKDAMVAIRAILERIRRGEVQLKGEMPRPPIAQTIRETP